MSDRLRLQKRAITTEWQPYRAPKGTTLVEITSTVAWKWSTNENSGSCFRMVDAYNREVIFTSHNPLLDPDEVLFWFKSEVEGYIYEKIIS